MKKRIKNLSEVEESLQSLYKKVGDEYVLELEDDEEDRFRAKHGEAEKHRKAAEDKVNDLTSEMKSLKTKLEELENGGHRKAGDVEALEKSYQKKLEDQKGEYEKKLGAVNSHLQEILVDGVANTLAAELSESPSVLLPHIRSRLTADLEGDKPSTKVLDKDGKPSASSLDELKNEFINNQEFAGVIKAGMGSGSGANRGSKGGSGAAKKFSEHSGEELSALRKSNPAEYDRLKKEHEDSPGSLRT